jgi:DNA topoisomerase VI subunit B/predicted transcriptional regulator
LEQIAEKMAEAMREVSVAEFFEKNRHLLGYENPTKALLTVVKELIDNSLDATNEAGILPEIKVTVKQVSDDRFKVIVEDNGPGIREDKVPYAFGKLLYGSKFYRLRQSVSGDERILIKEGNIVKSVNIGNFVNKLLNGDDIENISDRQIETLSFDPSTYKIGWRKISHVIRHKLEDPLYNVILESGRRIKVTGCHSIFVLDKESLTIKTKKTTEINEGDYVVVAKNIEETENCITEINMLDCIDIETIKKHRWYVYNLQPDVFDYIRKISKVTHSKDRHYRKFFVLDAEGKIRIRSDHLNRYEKLGMLPAKVVKYLKLYDKFCCDDWCIKTYKVGGDKYEFPAKLTISPELMRFLGFWVAEGHSFGRRLVFDFGEHEIDYINDIKKITRKLFKRDAKEEYVKEKSKIRLVINSTVLYELFKSLGIKTGSHNKEIPFLVFNVNKDMRLEFLSAMFKVDGCFVKEGDAVTYVTVSKNLASDLMNLLLLHGIFPTVSCKESKGLGRNASKIYSVNIYGKQLSKLGINIKNSRKSWPIFTGIPSELIAKFNPGLKSLQERLERSKALDYLRFKYRNTKDIYFNILQNIEDLSIDKMSQQLSVATSNINFYMSQLEHNGLIDKVDCGYKLSQNGQNFLLMYEKLKKIINSDLCFLKVKKIEKLDSREKYVYDISVPGCENFVAGLGGIICHNSRGVQGLGGHGAVLYSQLTTGKPTKITTSIGKDIHVFELMIDVTKNEPIIIKHEVLKNPEKWHGVKVEMEVEGRYVEGKQSIPEYIRQTHMANPYAHIIFNGPNGKIEYKRLVDEIPKQPKEIKPHPYGVEIGMLRRMLQSTRARNLIGFLTGDFSRVGRNSAIQILKIAKIDKNRKPHELSHEEIERLHKAMQSVKLVAPPTDCLSPLGEKLLEEGLKKDTGAEYVVAVTRTPSVYRGNPFVVECCSGDTEIILENGEIVPIKEYVEKNRRERVLSMDEHLKIKPAEVLLTHKIPVNHQLYRIRTKTGKEIVLTDNNEVPILLNGLIKWIRCDQLKKGQFIATPREIRIKGQKPRILDLLDENIVKVYSFNIVTKAIEKAKEKYGSLKNVSEKVGIDYYRLKAFKRKKNPTRPTLKELRKIVESIEEDFSDIKGKINKISIVDNKYPNPIPIKIPKYCNKDLLYIVGLVQSDGCLIQKDWRVSLVNTDERLHKLFSDKIERTFGLVCKRRGNETYINNKSSFKIIQKIIEILPTLEDSLVVEWLKGIVDGDGWISFRKDGRINRIGIVTASKSDAKLAQFMLLRLGIISSITKKKSGSVAYLNGRKIVTKKPQYNIEIRDIQNILKFAKKISFRQKEREARIYRIFSQKIEERSSRDVIPIGGLLRDVRLSLGLNQYELGFSDQTIRMVEMGRQNLTRKNLQFITKKLNVFDYPAELNDLAFSDILWDKIVEIRKLHKKEKFVYDLTTSTGNFVANNIVIHNCALAYGGNLPQDQPAQLFRFANKVPLLYHQSDCVTTEAVTEVDFRRYGFSQPSNSLPIGPLAILIHFASVWVPFTSEGKQAIASYPEILKEIKLALQEAGRKLAAYVRQKAKRREAQLRRELFERYIPEVSKALSKLTNEKEEIIKEKLESILKKDLKVGEDERTKKA